MEKSKALSLERKIKQQLQKAELEQQANERMQRKLRRDMKKSIFD